MSGFLIRAFIIVALAAAVFGGSAYFAYELYWKPAALDAQDRLAKPVNFAPPTPPDYSAPAFQKAETLVKQGNLDAARVALWDFVQTYPDSPNSRKAKEMLGKINSDRIFGGGESAEKTLYAVERGDSLARIASKFKTNPELIYRLNNLDSINLQVGQQLLVPNLDPSLVIDRKAQSVVLLNKGEFFKEYPALSIRIPGISSSKPTKAKVLDKVALQDDKRVAFGQKDYVGSQRCVMLNIPGIMIRGADSLPEGNAAAGIFVSPSTAEEIFILVSRGTPITIQ